jgi:dipeptidyl aminopeptidase/acylaminoacyl peptidase
LILLAATAATLSAQQTKQQGVPSSVAPAHAQQRTHLVSQMRGTAPAAPSLYVAPKADGKKAMTVADYARWRTVRDVALSDNGTWATFGYQQRKVDDTLFVRNLSSGAEQRIPRGTRPQFSDDSHWVAYFVAPPQAQRGGGAAAQAEAPTGRGGRGGQGGGPQPAQLRNLSTGAVTTWDNVASFAFNKGSNTLIVRKARAGAAPEPAAGRGGRGGGRGGAGAAPARVDGTDMILHSLANSTDELVGNVSDAEFNKPGSLLAYTVSAADREGNGLYLIETKDGSHRVLDNTRADYSRLTWDETGTAIAALRGTDVRGHTEKENTLIAFANLESAEPEAYTLGRREVSGLPDSMVISEKSTLSWSPDHSKVFVGLTAQETRPSPRRDSTADVVPIGNVDVWSANDPYIQSVQMTRAAQDRNRTYTATVLLAQKRVVPLADERMDRVQVTHDGRWAIGQDDKSYIDDSRPSMSDIYRVNTSTGERTPVLKEQERTFGITPDGKYFLYWKGGQIWSYDIAANTSADASKSTTVSFVNAEDDHIGEKPAYGVAGYTTDGKYAVVENRYDLWLVSLDGSAPPRDLTRGVGAKTQTILRYVRMEPPEGGAGGGAFGGGGRGGRGGAAEAIDLSKPVILSAFGDLTKKAGFYRLDGDSLTQLTDEDKAFGTPIKARDADRVLITREDWTEFPDYYQTDSRFSNLKKITAANPQQSEFLWGRRILFDYKDKDGHKLQGTLAIPDTYQPGQKLPMIVDYYEKYSQNLHRYAPPRYATAPQFVDYVSNGYLVMQPDVYYHTGRSHTDMLNSVEAAVRRVEELGYADPARVGLHGHSYSGQGSAYISTQSKLFAAVVAGAAASDLIADFNQLWKSTGTNQHNYDMYGQGRFGTNPYDNLALFMDQSAVFHAPTMNTNLLILQGTNDGSTEWLQGVEFYNALRFLHKSVIFLSYEGEAHNFTRFDNQYDVEVRIHQFYDHYLKGEPSADWIAHGVPFLAKKTPTGEAAQPVQLMGGGAGIGTPMTGGAGGGGGGGAGGGGNPPGDPPGL